MFTNLFTSSTLNKYWYLGSSNYNKNFVSFSQLKGKVGYAHTIFNKLTAHFTSEAGITIGENLNRALENPNKIIITICNNRKLELMEPTHKGSESRFQAHRSSKLLSQRLHPIMIFSSGMTTLAPASHKK